MQMQKKITVKDDGRFLTYYHFPDTATAEETQAFEGIAQETGDRGQGTEGTGATSGTTNNKQQITDNIEGKREEEKGAADAASAAPTSTKGDVSHV